MLLFVDDGLSCLFIVVICVTTCCCVVTVVVTVVITRLLPWLLLGCYYHLVAPSAGVHISQQHIQLSAPSFQRKPLPGACALSYRPAVLWFVWFFKHFFRFFFQVFIEFFFSIFLQLKSCFFKFCFHSFKNKTSFGLASIVQPSEKAFFDHSLLGLLYFPEDQKLVTCYFITFQNNFFLSVF